MADVHVGLLTEPLREGELDPSRAEESLAWMRYQWIQGELRRQSPRNRVPCIAKCMGGLLLAVNLMLMVVVAAIMLITIFVNEVVVRESFEKVCVHCGILYELMEALLGTIAVFSLVGFLVVISRHCALRVAYCAYLTILLLFSLVVTGTLMFARVRYDYFGTRWREIIAADVAVVGSDVDLAVPPMPRWGALAASEHANYSSRLCGVELEFRCSGWTARCMRLKPYDVNQSVREQCPICTASDQSTIATYTTTCEEHLSAMVYGTPSRYISTAFALLAIAILSIVANGVIAMRLPPPSPPLVVGLNGDERPSDQSPPSSVSVDCYERL